MTPFPLLRRAAGAVLVALLTLSACSGATEGSDTTAGVDTAAYRTDIASLRQEAQSTGNAEFLLKILEDDVITDQEIIDLNSQHVACMHSKGFPEFGFDPFTGEHLMPQAMLDDWDTWMPASDECDQQTGNFIMLATWNTIRRNPKNIDEDEYFAACLVKLGVVDSSFSGNDMRELTAKWSAERRTNGQASDDLGPLAKIPFLVSQEEGFKAADRCSREPQKVMYGD